MKFDSDSVEMGFHLLQIEYKLHLVYESQHLKLLIWHFIAYISPVIFRNKSNAIPHIQQEWKVQHQYKCENVAGWILCQTNQSSIWKESLFK